MNIVSIGAHQDDIELNCLGTLIKYRELGNVTITNVTVSNGDKGGNHDPSIPYAKMAAIRIQEATAVARALGGRYICLGQPDEYIHDTDETRNQLADILRAASADIVFGPPPVDYNTDHTITSELVFHACLLSSIRSIKTGHEPLQRAPALYYMDSIAGMEFQPTHYVDVSAVFEEKCTLLQLHESQMLGMRKFGGWDLIQYATIINSFRGLQCSVGFAEGFSARDRLAKDPARQLIALKTCR